MKFNNFFQGIGIKPFKNNLSGFRPFNRGKNNQKRLTSLINTALHQPPVLDSNLSNLSDAVAQAENKYTPNKEALFALYKNILKDRHLQSQLRTYIFTILQQDFVLIKKKTGEIIKDIELKELLERPWMDELITEFLMSPFWGYTLIELGKLVTSDENPHVTYEFSSAEPITPRECVKGEFGIITLHPSDISGISYTSETAKKTYANFILEAGKPGSLGLLEGLAEEVIIKRMARSDWLQFGRNFGQPLVALFTDVEDEVELKKRDTMLAKMGRRKWSRLSKKNDHIEYIESKGMDVFKMFLEQILLSNSENSKLVNGQTSTSDQKSFVGSAKVHEDILGVYTAAGMRSVQKFINYKLFPKLIEHGYPLKGIKFEYPALKPKSKNKEKGGVNNSSNPNQNTPNPNKEVKSAVIRRLQKSVYDYHKKGVGDKLLTIVEAIIKEVWGDKLGVFQDNKNIQEL